ncbi:MAG: hypothetical protein GYA21_17935 [Myxococcales bacterium]|nr:hypothetical protein [Myxococcales bacterium]
MWLFNPLQLKDFVTLGNVLGGIGSMIASLEGSIDWACYLMLIAWVFDSLDGPVARATGGGNRFGEVFDNVADLVAYSLAPGMLLFLVFRLPFEAGGAGWPAWAAGLLAAFPIFVGCVRFSRNDVMELTFPEFHLGLPRTVYALYLGTLFCSHLYRGPWMSDPQSTANAWLFGAGAVFVTAVSALTLTVRPYHAKPKKPTFMVLFSTVWFIATSALSFVAAAILSMPRLVFDVFAVNFTLYTWFGWSIIPRATRADIRAYCRRMGERWKAEMG